MIRLALVLAFFGGAIAPFKGLYHSYGLPEVLPFPHLALCLPAAVIGFRDAIALGGRLLAPPLAVGLGLAGASLLWVDPSELGRGMLVFAGIATSVPIAAMILRRREYRLCAAAFIAGSFVLLLFALGQDRISGRLGYFVAPGFGQVADPNEFGSQMAAAALLTACFFTRFGRGWFSPNDQPFRESPWNLVLVGAFTVATLLTGSRGALLCLCVPAAALIMGPGAGKGRVDFALALTVVGLAVAPFAMALLEPVLGRLGDPNNVGSFGSRLEIWRAAWDGRQEIGWQGVGVGAVEKQIAYYSDYGAARRGLDGITRLSSHNGFVEWLVALGLPGAFVGGWAMLFAVRRARRLDRHDGAACRQALLIYCVTLSMSLVAFRLNFWPPFGALVLGCFCTKGATQAPVPNRDRMATNQRGASHRHPGYYPAPTGAV